MSTGEPIMFNYERSIKEVLSENGFDFYSPSRNSLGWLTEPSKEGAAYGALNNYRSAASLISQDKISGDPMVSRFLKGIFRLRPTRPKYVSTWDVSIVLDFLRRTPRKVRTERLI